MSDSGDSETEAWERELMRRGRHGRPSDHPQVGQTETKTTIDSNAAKKHIDDEIKKLDNRVKTIKSQISELQPEIEKHDRRTEALIERRKELEQNNKLFRNLAELVDNDDDILNFLRDNKSVILKLPDDQKETLLLLEKRMELSESPMELD